MKSVGQPTNIFIITRSLIDLNPKGSYTSLIGLILIFSKAVLFVVPTNSAFQALPKPIITYFDVL